MKYFRILTTVILLSILCGCGTVNYYSLPAETPPSEAASVTGTHLETGALLADQRFFIYSVDGTLVKNAPDYSDKELLVQPGQRVLSAHFEQGSMVAEADFVAQVTSGQKLRVVGRIVESGNSFFQMGPNKVGFLLLDLGTNSPLGPEILKPVSLPNVTMIPYYSGK